MSELALDHIDIEVIRHLQEDVRMPVATMAERMGVAESTVRNRLSRLLASGAVELSAWVNPAAVDHRVWVMIDLTVDMRQIDDVAQRLAQEPEVYYVGIATGTYDIHAAAVFRSNDALLEFLTGRLASIRGIQRAFTSTIIKKIKRTNRYAKPEALIDTPPNVRKATATRSAAGVADAAVRGDAGRRR